jgi:ABC-type bacteriocin/lantibiotic exporter with double-glycine peptidase domain
MQRFNTWAAPIATGLFLVSCLYQGTAESVDEQQMLDDPDALRVAVPVVKQSGDKDCGVAALAAILSYWGQPSNQSEIRRATGVPTDRPISANLLQDYLWHRGFESFLIAGTLTDLQQELTIGRPALVGMLKPYAGKRWLAHYEVVTGISPKHVYTMNPAGTFERYPIKGFEREWAAAKHLTLVIAPRSRERTVAWVQGAH